MKNKKVLWAIASFIIAGLTIWAVASQSRSFSPADLYRQVQSSNKLFMLLALVSMTGYIWFEGIAVMRVASSLGYRKNLIQGAVYGAADVYFSAITPSATGGQPASAYFMIRDGIPAAASTVCLLINLVMYTLALIIPGLFALVFRFPVFMEFSTLSKVMITLGTLFMTGLGLFFLLLLKKPAFLHGICDAFLKLLTKIHLVKRAEKLRKKLNKTMEEYSLCSSMLFGKGAVLIEVFFWNLCQRFSYFFVCFFVFLASGHGLPTAVKAAVIQCFVCVGSNCIPIPGAMGAADYMLLDGFGQILSGDAVVTMEMLCRGITFYGSVSLGLIIVIISYFAGRVRTNRKGE